MEMILKKQLRICQEEIKILKEKLHVHLDRWTLDKTMFEEIAEKATRELHLKEAEHAYDRSRTNLLFRAQERNTLALKEEIESAVEGKEVLEVQVSALTAQLQEDMMMLCTANKRVQDLKASLPLKVSSKSKKLVMEAERQVHQLKKSLHHSEESRRIEVEKMKEQHTEIVAHLKEEFRVLRSQKEKFEAQLNEWKLDRKEWQADLQERDNLRFAQEQWDRDRKELQALLQEVENLRAKQDQYSSRHKEIADERDQLRAEKDIWILGERKMQELVIERDRLNAQQDLWLAQEKEIQKLVKERDKLRRNIELSSSQREEEVKALVRERDFVWSQMKKMEEDYAERLEKMSGKTLGVTKEIERLRHEVQEAQLDKNEKMVEMTILKLESKRIEDLATRKQAALEAGLQELHSRLDKVMDDNKRLIADLTTRDTLLLELTSQKEALEKHLEASSAQEDGAAAGGTVKEGPEVLNGEEGFNLDPNIFESQVEQGRRLEKSNEANAMEELRRENENLRQLYGELEVRLKEKKAKRPDKMARKSNRDPLSRKLDYTTASDEDQIFTRKSQKNKIMKSDLEKQRPESNSSDLAGVSQRRTRSSKRKSSDRNLPSPRIVSESSPSRGGAHPHFKIPTLDTGLEQHEIESVPKHRRKVDSKDFTSIQRPPLHTIVGNQNSGPRPAMRRRDSKGLSHDSENKPLPESFEESARNKMMTNLFSSAFSVPRLKCGAVGGS